MSNTAAASCLKAARPDLPASRHRPRNIARGCWLLVALAIGCCLMVAGFLLLVALAIGCCLMVAGFFLLRAREPEKSREAENEYPKRPENTQDLRGSWRTKFDVEFPKICVWLSVRCPGHVLGLSCASFGISWACLGLS